MYDFIHANTYELIQAIVMYFFATAGRNMHGPGEHQKASSEYLPKTKGNEEHSSNQATTVFGTTRITSPRENTRSTFSCGRRQCFEDPTERTEPWPAHDVPRLCAHVGSLDLNLLLKQKQMLHGRYVAASTLFPSPDPPP